MLGKRKIINAHGKEEEFFTKILNRVSYIQLCRAVHNRKTFIVFRKKLHTQGEVLP